jgi:hypothetical protein
MSLSGAKSRLRRAANRYCESSRVSEAVTGTTCLHMDVSDAEIERR